MNNEFITVKDNITISAKRLEALKALLKAYYLGFYTPGKEKLQPYYDLPLSGESYYKPGVIESCEVEFKPNHNYCFGAEFADTIKYSDSAVAVIEYWPVSDLNTWDATN